MGMMSPHESISPMPQPANFFLEHHVQASGGRCGHDRLDLVDVVHDSGRAPHPGNGVLVAGIHAVQQLHDLRIRILRIGDARGVEHLPKSLGNLPSEFGRGVHGDQIVVRTAHGQDRFSGFRRVEHRVIDMDAGLRLELGEQRGRKILRPGVDVQRVGAVGGVGTVQQQQNEARRSETPHHHSGCGQMEIPLEPCGGQGILR
jgi:hypothetical protein